MQTEAETEAKLSAQRHDQANEIDNHQLLMEIRGLRAEIAAMRGQNGTAPGPE